MKNKYLITFRFAILLIILIGVASCGTIQKRNYNKGYAVNWFQGSGSNAIEVTHSSNKKQKSNELDQAEVQAETASPKPIEAQEETPIRDEVVKLNNLTKAPIKKTTETTIDFEHKKITFDYQNEQPWVDSTNKVNNPVDPKLLPKEPLSEWAFWLVMGSIGASILSGLLSPFISTSVGLGIFTSSISLLSGFALLGGLIVGIISLGVFKDNPGVYRGKNKAKAAVITSSILIGLGLIAILFVLIIFAILFV